jgi:hypothetical protein
MKHQETTECGEKKLVNLEEPKTATEVIEVFKTDVNDEREAKMVVEMLLQSFPGSRINFDLQDCDRVLRVEGKGICNHTVILVLKQAGFCCSVLE